MSEKFKDFGTLMLAHGVFLIALSGLGIACAVVVFRVKAPMFALIVGVLQIIADGTSCMIWGFPGPFNIVAFVAGVFVIIAALNYPRRPAGSYEAKSAVWAEG